MYINHKNTFKHISHVLIAVLILIISGTSFAEGDSASASDVSGYVTVTDKNGQVKRVQTGDKLEDGDVINTGNDSGVAILLADGSTVTLGPQSNYTIGDSDSYGGGLAQRPLSGNSPTLSTSITAGGAINSIGEEAPTNPGDGGSPTN